MRHLVLALVALVTLAASPATARDPKINSLASLTALRALSPQAIQGGRQDGDLAVITDTGGGVTGLYRFSQSSAAAASGVLVIQPTAGSGRWLLVSSSAASAVTGLASATPVAITSTAAVGTGTLAARTDHAHAHGAVATGASSHDADQVDFELADGSKKQVGAASDTVEAALSDIDAAFGAAVSTLSTTSKLLVGAINELAAHFAGATTVVGSKLYLAEGTDNGVNFVTILAAASMGANYTLTMDLAASISISTIVTGASAGSAAKTVTDAMLAMAAGAGGTLLLHEPVAGGTSYMDFVAPALTANHHVTFGDEDYAMDSIKAQASNGNAAFAATDEMLDVAGASGGTLTLLEPSAGGTSAFTMAAPALAAARAITLTDRDYNLTTIADQADLGVTNAATAQGTADAAVPDASYTAADDVLVGTGAGTYSVVNLTANTVLGKAGAAAVAIATVTSSTGVGDADKLLRIDSFGSTQGIVTGGGGSIWYKKTIGVADLNDADGDETETVVNLTGRDFVVDDAFFVLATECSGGAVGTATVELGTNDDTDGLVVPLNIFTGAGVGRYGDIVAAKGAKQPAVTGATAISSGYQMSTGGSLVARFLTTGGNTGDLTACSVTVYFHYAVVSGQ